MCLKTGFGNFWMVGDMAGKLVWRLLLSDAAAISELVCAVCQDRVTKPKRIDSSYILFLLRA